jgi:glycopeptide antibiotics resistance protein
MLSTLLVTVPWLAFAVLLVVIVIAPVAGRELVERSLVSAALLCAALVTVVALTLYPEGGRSTSVVSCAFEWPYLAPTAVESMANILLFAPVAILAGVRWRRPATAILGASVLSAVIELIQALVPAIGRACDTSDWITNTIGAAVGGLLAHAALSLQRRRTPVS